MIAAVETPVEHCDVAIVGGGMVGASLALALAPLGLDVAVIESVLPEDDAQRSFDVRTTALSNGTRRIFEGLGVWDDIAREATPIKRIHVSDRGRFGSAVIDAAEQGIPSLGFVAQNRSIGAALWRRLRVAPRTRLIAPATVTGIATGAERSRLEWSAGDRAGVLDVWSRPTAQARSSAAKRASTPSAGTTGRPP